jgi:hypothetical protein
MATKEPIIVGGAKQPFRMAFVTRRYGLHTLALGHRPADLPMGCLFENSLSLTLEADIKGRDLDRW